MVGLLDIAPLTQTVTVRDQPIEVTGVSAKGVAQLLLRFPELRALISGREVGLDQLLALGGDIVAAVIAAGCGQAGDAQAEAAAGRLGLDDQAELLAAIMTLTMPQGLGPFVDKLARMGLKPVRRRRFRDAGAELAEAIEALIAMGHASGDVWDYTPRRIAGFLRVAQARVSQEKADNLALQALAVRGDPKEVKRQHKKLARQG